jgi:hypothetical protein
MPEANPRAAIGGNTPDAIDYAKEESERLQRDYAALALTVEELTAQAEEIPEEIPGPEVKEQVVDLIKSIRDAKTRIEGLHDLEKQPFLRRGQGVDQFFFGLWDRLLKRDKKNWNGIGDTLGAKLTAYDVRILAEENERRRKAAEEAARVERERLAAVAKAEREAEEARIAAERARTPHTAEAKEEIAEQKEGAASEARIKAAVASAKAEETYVQTLARPADVMRTRTSSGTLGTMQEETFSEIEDQSKLDMVKLWPFIKFDAKQSALNSWARGTDFREQMAGAKIGRRPKSRVR